MSMEFSDVNRMGGGDNALMGLLAGSMINRDDDRGKTANTMMIVLAVIFFVIIFIIAIIALAMFNRDNKREHIGGNTDYAGLLAAITASNAVKCNDNGYDHDHFEIKEKIEHSEDRAQMRKIDSEIGAMGLLMQKTAADNEKTNLENFAKIENQLGQLSMGMTQVLQKQNNEAIISGVIQQLMYLPPCRG